MALRLADGDYQIEARIVRETAKAVRVDDGQREMWLPKRWISVEVLRAEQVLIRMRGWVAREKGLA